MERHGKKGERRGRLGRGTRHLAVLREEAIFGRSTVSTMKRFGIEAMLFTCRAHELGRGFRAAGDEMAGHQRVGIIAGLAVRKAGDLSEKPAAPNSSKAAEHLALFD